MTLVNSYLSGTRALGEISNYWNIFIMMFILIVLVIAFFFTAFKKKWMPPCDNKGNPPSGNVSCGPPRGTFLLIIGLSIIFISGVAYYSWIFRNNKTFQTVQGVGTEINILNTLLGRR